RVEGTVGEELFRHEASARLIENLFGHCSGRLPTWHGRVLPLCHLRPCRPRDPRERSSLLGAVLESTEETVQGHEAAFDVAFVGLRHLRTLRRRFLAVLEDSQRVAQLLDVAGQPITPLLPSVSPSGRKS